jgi:hypothetical protein
MCILNVRSTARNVVDESTVWDAGCFVGRVRCGVGRANGVKGVCVCVTDGGVCVMTSTDAVAARRARALGRRRDGGRRRLFCA